MLNRPLLYTAITRARSSCILVGDQASLAAAVRRDDSGGRHSGLADRLRG
jgi:ATP-dependent exoDNAse (exonuclease V) alpha subunit